MSGTSYQADADPIQGARAIRMNPAQLAQLTALLNPPPSAPPRADPAGALATHSYPGASFSSGSGSSVPNMSDAMAGSAMMPGGGPLGAAPSTSGVRALTNALASAPMPPVRPANLGAPAPPPGAIDPSANGNVPLDPSIAARVSAANPATYSPNSLSPAPFPPAPPSRPFTPTPPAVPASLAAVNAAATEAGLADPTGGWQPPGRPVMSAPQPPGAVDPTIAALGPGHDISRWGPWHAGGTPTGPIVASPGATPARSLPLHRKASQRPSLWLLEAPRRTHSGRRCSRDRLD